MNLIRIVIISLITLNLTTLPMQSESSTVVNTEAPNGKISKIIKSRSNLSAKEQGKVLAGPIRALAAELNLSNKEKAELRAAVEGLRYQTLVGSKNPRLSKKANQVYNKTRQLLKDATVQNSSFQETLNYVVKALK